MDDSFFTSLFRAKVGFVSFEDGDTIRHEQTSVSTVYTVGNRIAVLLCPVLRLVVYKLSYFSYENRTEGADRSHNDADHSFLYDDRV